MPFCSSDSIVVRTGDSFTTIGSVTTIASFVPSSLRSMPTSLDTDADADAHGRDGHLARRNHLA